jgi:hypothetical protein
MPAKHLRSWLRPRRVRTRCSNCRPSQAHPRCDHLSLSEDGDTRVQAGLVLAVALVRCWSNGGHADSVARSALAQSPAAAGSGLPFPFRLEPWPPLQPVMMLGAVPVVAGGLPGAVPCDAPVGVVGDPLAALPGSRVSSAASRSACLRTPPERQPVPGTRRAWPSPAAAGCAARAARRPRAGTQASGRLVLGLSAQANCASHGFAGSHVRSHARRVLRSVVDA